MAPKCKSKDHEWFKQYVTELQPGDIIANGRLKPQDLSTSKVVRSVEMADYVIVEFGNYVGMFNHCDVVWVLQ